LLGFFILYFFYDLTEEKKEQVKKKLKEMNL
ncbi:unnamed protein product, partial [marine sediment metagenome]